MEYISQSTIYCSKGNLKCVLNYTKFPEKKGNVYMFKKNCLSLEHRYKNLVIVLTKKRGKNKFTFPIFDYELLSSTKQLKIGLKDCIFTINHGDIYYYNHQCFMSGGLMLDNIIMNLFSDTTK